MAAAGVTGAGVLVAGCGSDTGSSSGAATSPTASQGLMLVKLAAGIEVLAVNTYAAALAAAGQGTLGKVPDAFATFAQTVRKQHQDHADAWNAILTASGLPANTTPNPKYNSVVQGQVATLRTIVDVAKLALTLEMVAVETYVAVASLITGATGRRTALSIAPVEAEHVAILNAVLGTKLDATPQKGFIGTDMAAGLDSLNG